MYENYLSENFSNIADWHTYDVLLFSHSTTQKLENAVHGYSVKSFS